MTDRPWPADEVSRRRVADLVPAARNARTHSDAQVAQLVASIREWGWTMPVLVDETGGIIAGHGRVLAAQSMGLEDVPTMTAVGWTAEQKRAYVIADNKLAENAGWDADILRTELAELKIEGFDLGTVGFTGDELTAIFDLEGGGSRQSGAGSLAEKFGAPPFSVFNAREGWWQDRKRAWLALGIKSDLGRGDAPGTSARVGPDEEATYRPIGGRKPNAIPGGRCRWIAKPSQAKPSQAQPRADR